MVDRKLLSFTPHIGIFEEGAAADFPSWATREVQRRGSYDYPGEGSRLADFEIWAMAMYPNEEKRLKVSTNTDAILFDPRANLEELKRQVIRTAGHIMADDSKLIDSKPFALAWYTQEGNFRVAARPYFKKHNSNKNRDEDPASLIAVATSLP